MNPLYPFLIRPNAAIGNGTGPSHLEAAALFNQYQLLAFRGPIPHHFPTPLAPHHPAANQAHPRAPSPRTSSPPTPDALPPSPVVIAPTNQEINQEKPKVGFSIDSILGNSDTGAVGRGGGTAVRDGDVQRTGRTDLPTAAAPAPAPAAPLAHYHPYMRGMTYHPPPPPPPPTFGYPGQPGMEIQQGKSRHHYYYLHYSYRMYCCSVCTVAYVL